ncbi:MAG: SDR family oxidoreductase [Pseudomonadota bacterium]
MSGRPVALVTGGAARIGRAIVCDLAANGYDVAIHVNRSRNEGEALAHELIAEHGIRAVVVSGDLGDADAIGRIVPEAVALLGPLALLVNNASIFEEDSVATLTSDHFRRHMSVNAEAPARLISAFAAEGQAGGHGGDNRLAVNIIDQRVWKPTPKHLSYAASKATLWWLTKTMAQALAPDVRVNAIGPGPILQAASQSAEDFQEAVDAVPLKAAPDLADFGATIRYLHNTRSITGQMIALDAGQHLAWQTPDALVNE